MGLIAGKFFEQETLTNMTLRKLGMLDSRELKKAPKIQGPGAGLATFLSFLSFFFFLVFVPGAFDILLGHLCLCSRCMFKS